MLEFAIIGVAGYVAPRHLRAIKDCNGSVVAAMDPHDSVGLLDAYNKDCYFFTDFERFTKKCILLQPDYFVVCSPNSSHYEQCLVGLRNQADVICEKPVVLTHSDLFRLRDCEAETGKRVYTILQSRLKPELISMRKQVTGGHKVHLQYHTPRGLWYLESWKNDVRKSGGLATNIGIHMFDLLLWFFGGEFVDLRLSEKRMDTVVGSFVTPKAEITFDLSILSTNGVSREIVIDGERIDFTGNFEGLHTESYWQIIAGQGFGLEDAAPSIRLCETIRRM